MSVLEYHVFTKSSPHESFDEMVVLLAQINQEIFSFNETAEHLLHLFHTKEKIWIVLVTHQHVPIAFKIGFVNQGSSFESWRGGVSPSFRRHGIAKKLMHMQHAWCQANGIRAIETVVTDGNVAMMTLNIQCGFKVVDTFHNPKGILKVKMEKQLS